MTTPAVLTNNIFFGGGTITNQASAVQANNESGATTCLVDAANFDYHLVAGSPCVDAGADPGTGDGFALTPAFQYVQPASNENRTSVGTIDVGAYELGGGSGGSAGAGGATGTGGGTSSGGGAGTGATSGTGAASGTGGTTGAGGATGTGATSGTGGKKASSSGDSGGCGCRASGGTPAGALWLLLAAGSLLLARRRRGTQPLER